MVLVLDIFVKVAAQTTSFKWNATMNNDVWQSDEKSTLHIIIIFEEYSFFCFLMQDNWNFICKMIFLNEEYVCLVIAYDGY